MAAQLQIDQVGLPTGTPGVSRTDGRDNGAVVTLTNTGAGGVPSKSIPALSIFPLRLNRSEKPCHDSRKTSAIAS